MYLFIYFAKVEISTAKTMATALCNQLRGGAGFNNKEDATFWGEERFEPLPPTSFNALCRTKHG